MSSVVPASRPRPVADAPPRLVFMFSGQGSQYFHMGRELLAKEPVFARWMHELDGMVERISGRSVLAYLYDERKKNGEPFEPIAYSHPAIFMVEYALAQVLLEAGVRPDYVLGTSMGEFAACAVAGAVTAEQALEAVIEAARAAERFCRPGGLITILHDVSLAEEPVIQESCEVAAINSSSHFVIAGSDESLARVTAYLDQRGVLYQRLPVGYGFHSAEIDDAGAAYKQFLDRRRPGQPAIPIASCAYGRIITELEPHYFWEIGRRPIRLREAISALERTGQELAYLDLGPSGTLANLARYNVANRTQARLHALMTPFTNSKTELDQVIRDYARADQPTSVSGPPAAADAGNVSAYMFPGQGSQHRGMGKELFARYPEDVARVDAILGYSIEELCLKNPDGRLNQTQYTQPALYVVNALWYRARIEDGAEPPDYLAGHSLGEYNALLAADVYDFETGLRLVQRRGELMGNIHGGGMAAVIGLSEAQIHEVLAGAGVDTVDLANHNSPGQIVLSGPRDAIEALQPRFEAAGAERYHVLPVSGAFHSRYMAAASEELEAFLRQFPYSEPRIPVIANVDARPYSRERVVELLSRQLTSPVRWTESVQFLLRRGATCVEVGPGKVLSKLLAKIADAPLPPEEPGAAASEALSDHRAEEPAASARSEPIAEPGAASGALSEERVAQREAASGALSEERVAQREASGALPEASSAPAALGGGGQAPRVQRSRGERSSPGTRLGSESFRRDYGGRYAYVASGMYQSAVSPDVVRGLARAGLFGFLGTGVDPAELEQQITALRRSLPDAHAFGVAVRHNPSRPQAEERTVDVLLSHGIRRVEALAFLHVTPALVRFRLDGARSAPDGSVHVPNRVLAQVSRPEVAEVFLRPAPPRMIEALLTAGRISNAQAELARRIPVASDVCVGGDPGWQSEHSAPQVLLPVIMQLRERIAAQHDLAVPVRVGAGSGLGTPEAVASAFLLGAEFVATGSINQCTVEADTSEAVKELLAQAGVQDTDYAPWSPMFEVGARIEVLRRGVFYPARANRLYELYRHYESIESIDVDTRRHIEERYFQRSLESVYAEVRESLSRADLERAERSPKYRMALIFRWYCDEGERLARSGDERRRVDYQIHCGAALGAFNHWVAGTPLERWQARHADDIAERLMEGAAQFLAQRLPALTRERS